MIENDRERKRLYAIEYRKKNKEKLFIYDQKRSPRNRNKQNSEWLKQNPLKRILYNQNCLARRRGNNFLNQFIVESIYEDNIKKYNKTVKEYRKMQKFTKEYNAS